MQGVQVQSLVKELRTHMLYGEKKKHAKGWSNSNQERNQESKPEGIEKECEQSWSIPWWLWSSLDLSL